MYTFLSLFIYEVNLHPSLLIVESDSVPEWSKPAAVLLLR